MKRVLSVIFVFAILTSMCIPTFAMYESQEETLEVENVLSDSVGILKTETETVILSPSTAEAVQLNDESYAASVTYDVELSSDGSGQQSMNGKDVSAGASITLTIYYDKRVQDYYNYVRLSRVAINIDWSDDQIVLRKVNCSYKQEGMPGPGDGIIRVEQGSHNFPIAGHYYSHNTGFEHFAGVNLLGFVCTSNATITFARGTSQWNFTIDCSY